MGTEFAHLAHVGRGARGADGARAEARSWTRRLVRHGGNLYTEGRERPAVVGGRPRWRGSKAWEVGCGGWIGCPRRLTAVSNLGGWL